MSPASDRAAIFDEALPLIRRLWTEDAVDHDGAHFHYEAITVLPKPVQQPLDVWLGGRAPRELRRCRAPRRRLARELLHPARLRRRPRVDRRRGRGRGPRASTPSTSARWSSTPTTNSPTRCASVSRHATRGSTPQTSSRWAARAARTLQRFVAVGFSKLVLVPLTEPADWATSWSRSARRCSTCRPDGNDDGRPPSGRIGRPRQGVFVVGSQWCACVAVRATDETAYWASIPARSSGAVQLAGGHRDGPVHDPAAELEEERAVAVGCHLGDGLRASPAQDPVAAGETCGRCHGAPTR